MAPAFLLEQIIASAFLSDILFPMLALAGFAATIYFLSGAE